MYLKEEISFPPSPPSDCDLSGLKQLAEVSLATAAAGRGPLAYHSLLSSLLSPSLSISPSSSPSPPPAHSSPSPPPLDVSLNPLAKLFLPPPQESPLDLRVERKPEEMEEQEEEQEECQYSVPAYLDIRRDSVGTDSGESSGSEADLDLKKSLRSPASVGPAGFTCSDCGKSYSSSSNLARHRQSHRPDPDLKNCPHCSKEYSSPAALSMHMRTHTAGCKCPFCGKSFSRPWLLQGHIRTHTGEKPYACTQCNKSFADKSNLRAHVQTHSDVKPFNCERCGKKFALKSYLTKHEESSCLRLPGGRY